MHQLCQDALAIVRRMGKPDLFITMTTNPQWPEVVENLLPGQTVNDRPDLVARVFHLKFTEMMIDLQKQQVLGRVVAVVGGPLLGLRFARLCRQAKPGF